MALNNDDTMKEFGIAPGVISASQLKSLGGNTILSSIEHEKEVVALMQLTAFDREKCIEMLKKKPFEYWNFTLNNYRL